MMITCTGRVSSIIHQRFTARLLALVFAILGPLSAPAVRADIAPVPASVTYDIYVYDELAGRSEITFQAKGDVWLFESVSRVASDDYEHELRCRSEYRLGDGTWMFHYAGSRVGKEMEGTVWVEGDSLFGDLVEEGHHFPSAKGADLPLLPFENFVIEHQIIMFRYLARSTERVDRFHVVFPSSFAAFPSVGGIESEVELEILSPPAVCRKYQVLFQNGSPFFGYLDVERGIPVYIDFPSSNTEVFLAGAFGEKPPLKYSRPEDDRP